MYLHRLDFQAVGPFAGRHSIDFAQVGASGLFLLEGPTGAGKSTIIDMIVFALYGKVASAQTSESRIRSGHVTPEVETFVDLVLETGSGIYRIRRTPAYERPKRAGSGTTRQQASVRLWRLGSPDAVDGELLSQRLDEAGDQLRRIVGLDREQFVQTVVLPQGEFAGFLRADPEQRRGLLQKVFGTQVYEDVQQRLERMRADVNRALDDACEEVTRATALLSGALHCDAEEAAELQDLAGQPESLDSEDGLLDRAGRHVAALTGSVEAAAELAERSREVRRTAQTSLEDARRTSALLERRARLRAEQADLDAAGADHLADVERLRCADEAARLVPLIERCESARRDLTRAQSAEDQAREAAPADVLPDGLRGGETMAGRDGDDGEDDAVAAALATERDACTAGIAALGRAVALEKGLPARRTEVERAAERLTVLRVAADDEAARASARPGIRAAIEKDLQVARTAAAGVAAARERADAAQARLEQAEQAASLALQRDRALQERDAAAVGAAAAVRRESELRLARVAGLSGELAGTLVDGEPCTVCGSPEHPAPARRAEGHPSPEEVEEAEAVRVAAEAAHQAAALRAVALEKEHDAAVRAAGGSSPEEAKDLMLAARDVLETATTAGARVRDLESALAACELETVAIEAAARAAAQAVVRAESELGALRAAVEAEAVEVEQARGAQPTVGARVAQLQDRARRVGDWLAARGARVEAHARFADRDQQLGAALATSVFADVAEASAAALDERVRRELTQAVEHHRAAVVRVATALAEPEMVTLGEDVQVDVTGAEEAFDVADAQARRDAEQLARLGAVLEHGTAALEGLRRAAARSATVRVEAGPVVRMANLAAASTPDNTRRLTLASYVLTRRFEDVVAAANDRLLAMSAGRYALLRSEEKEETRGRRTGLAMKVVDHHTETERDPRTLSGGETFYVSLCLALGLADVVTAEAGGTDLGTLFIDEGFGSLDAATLDQVLVELGRLRDGGRVVGVVSHVDALKQAVAERVEVRPLAGGGSTVAVRA